MNLSRSKLVKWTADLPQAVRQRARSGVSLHNHSSCSRETLDFLPGIARRIPMVAQLFEAGLARYFRENGRPLDFEQVYWRPPLDPPAVVDSERRSIEQRLGLPALVALTDHDTIEGNCVLSGVAPGQHPFSLEWTVPFLGATFHLGVHNVPSPRVQEVERELNRYSRRPSDSTLADLLAWLTEPAESFIVLNHPLWDLAGVGSVRHHALLLTLLRTHASWIHALEINGYRRWDENAGVFPIAEGFDLPVVAAGDRHGCVPGALLTLSEATSFAELASDLRAGRSMTSVVLPEYREPFAARLLHGAGDALRHQRDHGGRLVRWVDRVFYVEHGEHRPLSGVWPHGGPWWLRCLVSLTRTIGADSMRPFLRWTLPTEGHA